MYGQSKRSFNIRKGEHQKQKGSVVYQHMSENKHEFEWKYVKLLDTERNYTKRVIPEMLFIKTQIKAFSKARRYVEIEYYVHTLVPYIV